jgi:hypothetical protein
MGYVYKVVPFIGQSRGTVSATDVATQLEGTIHQHASQGWEFCQLSDVNIEVQPGCIAGLLGARVEYVRFDQLIFRGDRTAAMASARHADDADVGPAIRSLVSEPVSEWRCSCGQRNPPSTDACLECGNRR